MLNAERRRWMVLTSGCGALLALAGTLAAQEVAAPRLISPAELVALQQQGPVSVIDVRQAWSSYLQNHLPDAAWLNVETLRSGSGALPFQLLPAQHYADLFARLGVGRERPVVVYSAGDQSDIDATFVVWLIQQMGQPDVRLLDGGYARWQLEARPLTQRYPRLTPVRRLNPKAFRPPIATLAEVRAATTGGSTLLVDARPAEQFAGSAGAQARRGHIPSAISHPWKDDLEQRDQVLVWKGVADLRAGYEAQGITPDRDLILYCNSSTEASHLFFALHYILGYPRIRIYTGAWSEWAEREDLPIER
ncbi:MAG: rhodanese-like domain-containing protein [Gemmatimonadales bacterium]